MLKPPFIYANKLDRKEKIGVFSCYGVLLLIYLIVTAIFILKAYQDFGSNTFDYFLLLENWRQPTISDIIITNQTLCPTNYSNLIPYEWGGSTEGCDCRDSWNPSDIGTNLETGVCSTKQKRYGCKSISKVSARSMPKWASGNLFCAKREKNDFFLNSAKLVGNDGSCQSGYIKCGSGGIFDYDRVFCTSAIKCPINSIVLSKYSPGADYQESVSFTTNQGSSYSLYWSRSQGNTFPIVELRVSEEKICLNNKKNYLALGHNEYLLANDKRVQCTEFDNRFSILDSMSEKAFFLANNFENIVSLLPTYTLSDTIQWRLYFRSVIDFKIQCRYMISELVDAESEASTLQSSIISSVIVMGVFLFVFAILYVIFMCCALRNIDSYKESRKPAIFGFLLNYSIRIICISVAASVKSKITSFAAIFDFVKGANCSDDLTNNFFNNLSSDLSSSVVRDLNVVIFFNVGLIIVDVVLAVFSCCCCLLPAKSENQQALNQSNLSFPPQSNYHLNSQPAGPINEDFQTNQNALVYVQQGHVQPDYPQPGYPQPGYPQLGYPNVQPGYPQPSYPQPGYPQPGYPQLDYQQPGNPQPGPQQGYPQEGYQQQQVYPMQPVNMFGNQNVEF